MQARIIAEALNGISSQNVWPPFWLFEAAEEGWGKK